MLYYKHEKFLQNRLMLTVCSHRSTIFFGFDNPASFSAFVSFGNEDENESTFESTCALGLKITHLIWKDDERYYTLQVAKEPFKSQLFCVCVCLCCSDFLISHLRLRYFSG